MRLNKMTGRVIATMGIAAMMMTQTAGVMAAEQTENKQLKVVYYNQADYPGKKIGGSTIQDRKSVVQGKSIDLGGRRIIKKGSPHGIQVL